MSDMIRIPRLPLHSMFLRPPHSFASQVPVQKFRLYLLLDIPVTFSPSRLPSRSQASFQPTTGLLFVATLDDNLSSWI